MEDGASNESLTLYTVEWEMKELCAEGPHEYFSSWRNWLDIAQFLNVLMIGPLALAGSSLAKVTASIGMLLMLPKMAQAHVATN
eukprot:5932156-Prymnesium_polylepis.1